MAVAMPVNKASAGGMAVKISKQLAGSVGDHAASYTPVVSPKSVEKDGVERSKPLPPKSTASTYTHFAGSLVLTIFKQVPQSTDLSSAWMAVMRAMSMQE